MAYENDRQPEKIHFYAASLEPSQDFVPEADYYRAEQLPRIHLDDDLPKHDCGSS